MTGCTSMDINSGAPPGPGAADARAAISYARLRRFDVDDPVTGQHFLGFRKRAVGDRRRTICVGAHQLHLLGPPRPSVRTNSPASTSSLLNWRRNFICALRLAAATARCALFPVPQRELHHQDVFHDFGLPRSRPVALSYPVGAQGRFSTCPAKQLKGRLGRADRADDRFSPPLPLDSDRHRRLVRRRGHLAIEVRRCAQHSRVVCDSCPGS